MIPFYMPYMFGEMATGLGDPNAVEPVLDALRGVASERRMKAFDRTLRWRGWDLASYWVRLPVQDKVGLLGDLVRWIWVR